VGDADRLAGLREQKADLERLRDSGLGDKEAIREKIRDLDKDIGDALRPSDPTPKSGPVSDEAERAVDEAASTPDPYGAGGLKTYPKDNLRSDLEYKTDPKPSQPTPSDEGPSEHLPSLVGEGAGTMGGGNFDGEASAVPPPSFGPRSIDDVHNFETFPAVPEDPKDPPIESVIPDLSRDLHTRDAHATTDERPLVSNPLLALVVVIAVVVAIAVFANLRGQPQSAASAAPTTAARTNAPAATEPTGPAAQTAAAAGYQCVGQQKTLFDNSNGNLVSNGAAAGPSFNTGGKAYCLVSMSTYHWNDGKGAGPGRVGLIGSGGNVGPTQAQGTSGQGGAQNVNWVYVPDAAARPFLNGDYTCYDSDKATWSQNDASGHLGFCRVFVLDAVKQ
jgi:hypothetical protein